MYKTEVSDSSPPCFPQGAPLDWSYIKQGWSLTKVGEMNEVKYSRRGSENSFVCWAMSEVGDKITLRDGMWDNTQDQMTTQTDVQTL